MNKSFVILSAIFIVACSDGEIGGYTESIIKGKPTSDANSALAQNKQYSLNKSASPLDEDLSGLDEEELREKLLNSYPRALAKDGTDPEPESSSSNECPLGTICILEEHELAFPYNPKSDEIKPFTWKELIPSFSQASNHKYGFDQDPEEKDPYLYISVKKGEGVSFISHFSTQAHNSYCLVYKDEKTKKYVFEAKLDNGKQHTIPSEKLNEKTEFKVFGNGRKKTCMNPKENQTFAKNIQVIPYEKLTKNIIFVQIGGDDNKDFTTDEKEIAADADYTDPGTKCKDGYFTRDCIKKYFDEIFGQAVVDVKVKQEPASKYIEDKYLKNERYFQNNILNAIMTSKTGELTNIAYSINYSVEKNISTTLPSGYTVYTSNLNDARWHTVFGVNRIRKKWELWKCYKSVLDLGKCKFTPENDPQGAKYYLYNPNEKIYGKWPGQEVEIQYQRITKAIDKKGEIKNNLKNTFRYSIFNKSKSKLIDPKDIQDGDILHTEDSYPIAPSKEGATTAAEAYSRELDEHTINVPPIDNEKKLFDDYLAYGSFVVSPRRRGLESFYILMHELGHSFGLTDVALTDILEFEDKAIFRSSSSSQERPNKTYTNQYGSSETNLMAWISPSGIKLRHRPVQIVCTGGKKISDKNGNELGRLEFKIPNGFEIDQWECIRNCYKDTHTTSPRKIYYLHADNIDKTDPFFNYKNLCKENKDEMEKENYNMEKEHYWDRIIKNRSSSSIFTSSSSTK